MQAVSNTSNSRFYFLYGCFHAIIPLGDFMDDMLLHLTENLICEIQSESIYKNYLKAHNALVQSADVQELIETFKQTSEKYYEAKAFGKHHPNLRMYQSAFSEAKSALYRHPIVDTFKRAEKALEDTLDEVSKRIAETVSSRVKANTKLAFLERGGSTCSSG